MDEWQIIGWFMLGLFCDNALGMLYAYKLGPDRAERLVIASLLNETVIKAIRDKWDFPRASAVTSMRHDLDSVLDRTVAEVKDAVKNIEVAVDIPPIEAPKVELSMSATDMKVLRDSFKREMEVMFSEQKKTMQSAPDLEVQYQQAQGEAALMDLGGVLLDAGVPESWVHWGMSKGLPIFKRLAIERYPDVVEGIFSE